jgi:hypothetical protein
MLNGARQRALQFWRRLKRAVGRQLSVCLLNFRFPEPCFHAPDQSTLAPVLKHGF